MSSDIKEMPSNPMVRDKYIPEKFKYLGLKNTQRRIDGQRKAGGSAVYTRDIILPGMLYARFFVSPYPNAKILKMNTSKAEAMPGVRAVLRYDDPEIKGKVIPTLQGGEEMVVAGSAYYHGQPMGAVVVATSAQIADEALRTIEIEWEQRAFNLDAKKALAPDAALSRPEWRPDGNLLPLFFQPTNVFGFGDVEKGLAEADKVIEFTARRRYHGCPDAEPVSGVVRWEEDCAELWVHSQHPYEHKWMMNQWFDMPMAKVKINSPFNGGMFGGFNWIDYSLVPTYIAALMAKRLQRPVKWQFDRKEAFMFGSLDAMETDFTVGFKKDGTITAVKIKSLFENLSYEPGLHLLENTKIANVESETNVAQVNKGPTHAIRCEQLPPSFVMTHLFNHVAAELGMDPTELAIINDGADGEGIEVLNKHKKELGFPVRDSLQECLAAGKKTINWDANYHAPGARKLPNGRYHGMGLMWDHEWEDNRGAAAAALMIQQDGTVSIIALRADVGVNAESTYCAIVAEELGMRLEDVHFRQNDDVHLPLMTPDGSCNLTTNGYVMKKIAKKAKQKLLELAVTKVDALDREFEAAFPGYKPEDLDVDDSFVFVKADPSNRKSVADVVRDLRGSHSMKHPYGAIQNTTHDPIYVWAWHRQGALGKEPGRHRMCRQVHFCEVEVDVETGDVDVTRVVNVNDVGKALCPEGVEGQQYGGTYMGIGRNMSEEHIWDPATGVLLNANLIDYKFATLLDVGPIDTIIVETGMGLGPYGSVGIGEDVANDTTYLVHGAVYNAIGKWVDDGPITPDKVLNALNKA